MRCLCLLLILVSAAPSFAQESSDSPTVKFILGAELSTASSLETGKSVPMGGTSGSASVGTAFTTVLGGAFGGETGGGANISISFDSSRSLPDKTAFSVSVIQFNATYRFDRFLVFAGGNTTTLDYKPKMNTGDTGSVSGSSGYQAGAEFQINERASAILYMRSINAQFKGVISGSNVNSNLGLSGLQVGMRYYLW